MNYFGSYLSVNFDVCFTDGLRLLPAFTIMRRGLALSAKNAASLSNIDRNLAAAAASSFSQSDTATGMLLTYFLWTIVT